MEKASLCLKGLPYRWELSSIEIYVHLLNQNQEQLRKMQLQVPGMRNQTCGPAIPIQRSNQLSYRGRALTTSSCIGYCHVQVMGKYRDFVAISLDSIINIVEGSCIDGNYRVEIWLDNWPLQLNWLERCTGIAGSIPARDLLKLHFFADVPWQV